VYGKVYAATRAAAGRSLGLEIAIMCTRQFVLRTTSVSANQVDQDLRPRCQPFEAL